MLLIIRWVQMFPVNSRIVAIGSHIARFCKFQTTTTLLYLSQCIIMKVIRVLMSELRVRLLENEVVDVLILFAILFLRLTHDSSVTSKRPLIPITTFPIAVVGTADHTLPLLYSDHAIGISRLAVPIGQQCLLAKLVLEYHLRLSIFDCLRNVNIRLSHL